MNKIEKFVYDKVKSNPRIKTAIRNIYQSAYDILPDKKDELAGQLIEKPGYFFGFHDVSPWSPDEQHILSNKLEIELHMPTAQEPLTVGFWNADMTVYTPVAQTHAWNYHKGCRLQWVGNSSELFIFNDVVFEYIIRKKAKVITLAIPLIGYMAANNKTCTLICNGPFRK